MRKQSFKAKRDNSNILRLVLKETTPCTETIADIEELLRLAKTGRLKVFSYVGLGDEGLVDGVVGLEDKYRNTMKGALLALAIEL